MTTKAKSPAARTATDPQPDVRSAEAPTSGAPVSREEFDALAERIARLEEIVR